MFHLSRSKRTKRTFNANTFGQCPYAVDFRYFDSLQPHPRNWTPRTSRAFESILSSFLARLPSVLVKNRLRRIFFGKQRNWRLSWMSKIRGGFDCRRIITNENRKRRYDANVDKEREKKTNESDKSFRTLKLIYRELWESFEKNLIEGKNVSI